MGTLKQLMLPLFCFILTLTIYIGTAIPSVDYGDSGELIAAAYTLSIAHPSGYPLYTLLGKLSTYLPLGTVASRVNLISAIFGALAVCLLFLSVRLVTKNDAAALVSSLLFAFSHTFWSQATTAEVHSLNLFLNLAVIYCLLIFSRTREINKLYLASFLLGLSFTNHLLTIVLIPAFLFTIFSTISAKEAFKPRRIAIAGLLFLLPLMLYAYLPIRSLQNPVLDWGSPNTLPNFIAHVSGAQYRGYMGSVSPGIIWKRIREFASILFTEEYSVYYGWLGILGIYHGINKRKKVLAFATLIFITNLLVSFNYGIPEIKYYYIQAYLAYAILIGLGIEMVIEAVKPLAMELSKPASTVFIAFIYVVLLSFPVFSLAYNYKLNDKSSYTHPRDCGILLMSQFPDRSIVFTRFGGELFVYWYLQYVEGIRRDVRFVHYASLTTPWYMEHIKKEGVIVPDATLNQEELAASIIRENINSTRIFVNAEDPSMENKAELAFTRCSKYVEVNRSVTVDNT